MPPRKKKRKAKTPKSRPTQSQSQRVTINIGSTSKSKPRKSSGRGGLPPPSHMHNLAPTFVTAPQVDYTPLLAMMQHHASPIVSQAPMPVQNPTTPLSSATIATNTPSQMAGEAALRRAGRTADNFQPPASLSRSPSVPELVASLEAKQVTAAVAQPAAMFEEGLIKKGMGIGRAVGEKNVEKKVSEAQQRGAAEERDRAAEERDRALVERATLASRRKAFGSLQDTAQKAKIKVISQELEKVKPSSVTPDQRSNFRSAVFGAGINLTDLTSSAQARTRKPKAKSKPLRRRIDSSDED